MFSHTLEHKAKSFLCRQSRQIHCPKEAATWAELCSHADPSEHVHAALRELAGHCECSASLAAFLPYMFASQMASSQETACLSTLDGTPKSPRATASYWHLGGGLPFTWGYSVNLVLQKPEGSLQKTALIHPALCMARWEVSVSPSVSSRLRWSNLPSAATSTACSTASCVKRVWTTCFSGNTAGCLKF